MIGENKKLCFDKANQVFSYFLKSIKIVHDHGGKVMRIWDFVDEMATFCNGNPRKENGEENRAWYNKSLFPRYYGFLDLQHTSSDKSGDYLCSTPWGVQLLALCEERAHPSNKDNDKTLYIPECNLTKAYDLFLRSLTFQTFGRNNTGAEQSQSDIDPPKVMLNVIYNLDGATKEEICYSIYALHRGVFNSLSDVIEQVKKNRSQSKYSYSEILKKWGLENIAGDFKLAKLLADPGIAMLSMTKDSLGNEKFEFDNHVPEKTRQELASFDGFFHAKKWMFIVNNMSAFPSWVRDVVAGSTHDDGEVFITELGNSSFKEKFSKAIIKAFCNPSRNIYFAISGENKNLLLTELGDYLKLLTRIDDFRDDYNGWSQKSVLDAKTYQKICRDCSKYRGADGSKIKDILEYNAVKLPPNFHFIGGIKHD